MDGYFHAHNEGEGLTLLLISAIIPFVKYWFRNTIRGRMMQDTPTQSDTERDYHAGYARVMWFAEQARRRGWRLSDRQLFHEIRHRERAAQIRERSSLPVIGPEVHSAAWNRGQADALREILRLQREQR